MRRPEEIGEIRDIVTAGVGAETLLGVMGKLADDRIRSLLVQLGQAPADLPILLDLRAKITEVMRIKDELQKVATKGREASDALRDIFVA